MKRKLCVGFFAMIVCCIIFLMSSCTYFDVFSVDSLIRAPKLTGENAEIQSAFENAVGKNVSLVNPLSGDFRSAYVLFDYNGDDINEAIVFYSKNDTPDEIHMHLLECYDDIWQSACDITGNGSEVYKIDFVNLDKDSDLEISVVWALSDSKKNKTLSLYKASTANSSGIHKSLVQISSTQVTDYMITDMDFDNQNEVFYSYLSFESNNPTYSAVVAKLEEETLKLVPISEVALSKNIEQLIGISTDVKDAVFSVYVDCIVDDGRYFTEIMTYDYLNKILIRPVTDDGTLISLLTYRYESLCAEDINSDFMIEIPSQAEFSESSYADSDNSEKIYITTYSQFKEGLLQPTESYYINHEFGFKIRVDKFFDISYLIIDSDTHTFSFRLKDCVEEDDLLFSLILNQSSDFREKYSFSVTPLGERFSFSEKKLYNLIVEKRGEKKNEKNTYSRR